MIVMKFGGTSVQDAQAIDQVAKIVKGRVADRPVVVVSAMAKVTDSLLAMGKAAGAGDRKTALKMARALRERHYDTAGELLGTALFTEFHGGLGEVGRTIVQRSQIIQHQIEVIQQEIDDWITRRWRSDRNALMQSDDLAK